jgi:uncharacterized membrane protein
MTPAIIVAGLWIAFAGTHIGLSAVRSRMVARIGEIPFVVLFYIVAAITFAALVTYYAAHRWDGLPALALGNVPIVRWPLMGIVTFGIVLMTAALVDYPRLPTALFDQPIRGVRGIERVTRHPFFSGAALLGGAHMLLATHLSGVVFFGGLAVFALLGALHQDHKLTARRGRAYADYCAATSMIPFAAVLDGRQPLVWRELPLRVGAIGLILSLALRYGHDHLFARGGLWIVVAVVGGGGIAGINAWRRARGRNARSDSKAGGGAGVVARLLMLTGIGHFLLGLVLFRAPLAAIIDEGVFSTIGYGQFDRASAFWFLLFGPACVLLGQLVGHGIKRGDRRTLTLIGWNLLAMGVGGALVMPISGFWILIALAPLILRQASRTVGSHAEATWRESAA